MHDASVHVLELLFSHSNSICFMTLLQCTGALIISIKLYVGSEMGWWGARGGGGGEGEDPQPYLCLERKGE